MSVADLQIVKSSHRSHCIEADQAESEFFSASGNGTGRQRIAARRLITQPDLSEKFLVKCNLKNIFRSSCLRLEVELEQYYPLLPRGRRGPVEGAR